MEFNWINRKLTLNTHSVPCDAWKSSCGPNTLAFLRLFVLVFPLPTPLPPYPLTLIPLSEQVEALPGVGCPVPWVWASHVLRLWQQPGSREGPAHQVAGPWWNGVKLNQFLQLRRSSVLLGLLYCGFQQETFWVAAGPLPLQAREGQHTEASSSAQL